MVTQKAISLADLGILLSIYSRGYSRDNPSIAPNRYGGAHPVSYGLFPFPFSLSLQPGVRESSPGKVFLTNGRNI
jgi:hypothetical protein